MIIELLRFLNRTNLVKESPCKIAFKITLGQEHKHFEADITAMHYALIPFQNTLIQYNNYAAMLNTNTPMGDINSIERK